MVRLSRTIRFCINPGDASETPESLNGFGGKPPMRGLGRYYELDLIASGTPDPITGYLINIKQLDQAARERLLPIIRDAVANNPEADPATLLPAFIHSVQGQLEPASLESIRWRLTPYYSVEMIARDRTTALLRQQFDLAAAHRLHADALSDEENRDTFGRCNNPAGHGHNYKFEPTVAIQLRDGAPQFTLLDLERLVAKNILEPFDHTHLNLDRPEFGQDGVIPSVENIAKVFYHALEPAITEQSNGVARLLSMTVWETDRTSCTYPESAL